MQLNGISLNFKKRAHTKASGVYKKIVHYTSLRYGIPGMRSMYEIFDEITSIRTKWKKGKKIKQRSRKPTFVARHKNESLNILQRIFLLARKTGKYKQNSDFISM